MELSMSTTAPVTENSLDLAIKTDNVTYQVWVKLDDKGKVIEEGKDKPTARQVTADSDREDEVAKKLTDEGFVLGKTQVVKSYRAGTMDGFVEIIGDPEEALVVANKGIAAKFNQKAMKFLLDFDTEAQTFVNPQTDDVADSREWLQEPTQKRSLTPADKMIRALRGAGYSDKQIAAAISALQASSIE